MFPTLTHYSGIISDIPSGNIYDILYIFWHSIWYSFWHILWHSIWHMYLAYLLTSSDILSGIFWHSIWYIFGDSLWLRSGGEHWSGACGGGPAGITMILSLLFGSSRGHCNLELAVEVRRGTLWSRACCSGKEHCDLELAVEVRRGSLWSRGCCSGPAETTAI